MTDEIKEKIKSLIENTIRPRLQADGGNIELVKILDTGIVQVRLTGACASCPFSQMTLSLGVEKTLKDPFPEVERVEVVQ